MELRKFARMWGEAGNVPVRVEEDALRSVEARFGIRFPSDYFAQVVSVGLPWPPRLLSAILDRGLELHDLSRLCSPEEIVEETEVWRSIGMPDHLIVIGSDCAGNKFCFDILELSNGATDRAAIFFWDHDFDRTTKIATSFSVWISGYVEPWNKRSWFSRWRL